MTIFAGDDIIFAKLNTVVTESGSFQNTGDLTLKATENAVSNHLIVLK